MKISFDFDGTLSEEKVQKVAKKLMSEGHTLYITTSRFLDPKNYEKPNYNHDDLYGVAKEIGIKTAHIIFTDFADKYFFVEMFDIHLDNDYEELNNINSETKCRGISVVGTSAWIHKIYKIIDKYDK